MKVFAIAVDPTDLKKSKGETFKNFPIPMPRQELEEISAFCQEHGINRCEWARRVLLASFRELVGEQSA